MTAATVAGIACAENDIGAEYHRSGRLASAKSFDQLICDLPAAGIQVDIGHSGEAIGQMIYGERDAAGRLGAVCVIDDGQWLIDYPGDIHFSPLLLAVGDRAHTRQVAIADRAGLVAIGLTDSPATVGSRAVDVLAGDLRDSADRSRWPISWRQSFPLLARARDHLGPSPWQGTATRLVDQRDHQPAHGWVDPDGRPLPAGPMHHGPPGRILSVR